MRMIKTLGLIVVGVVLGVAGTLATSHIEAQAVIEVEPLQPGQPVGGIITGENIGFQLVAGKQGDVATGKLMIKVGGRWLPAAAPMGAIPLAR